MLECVGVGVGWVAALGCLVDAFFGFDGAGGGDEQCHDPTGPVLTQDYSVKILN